MSMLRPAAKLRDKFSCTAGTEAAPDERSHKRKRNDRRAMMRAHKLFSLFDPAADSSPSL